MTNEWNEQIKQQNRQAIAEAHRLHELKQAALQHVIAANRILVDAFRDEGEMRDMPEDIREITSHLGKIMRELDAKQHVELLGQALPEFRLVLPSWAEGGTEQSK